MSIHTLEEMDPVQRSMRYRRSRRRFIIGALLVWAITALYWRYVADTPHDYVSDVDHFKYGSIGADTSSGIPYWIWWVLPDMFPDYLPDKAAYDALPKEERNARAAYEQFGFVREENHDLPIGFSVRRLGVDRVGLNCAVCHVSTVRVTADMNADSIYDHEPTYTSVAKDRVIILGMPAATVDLGAYINFIHKCGTDTDRFTADKVLAAIEARHPLNPIDRLIYKRAVPVVADTIKRQRDAFRFLRENPEPGPGRVDTFNPYKCFVFNSPFDGTIGTSDFPSIWNQRAREGLRLHWDGNNTSVFERNISAALGAGATPVSVDLPRMLRVAYWIGSPDPHRDLTDDEIRDARNDPRPKPGEMQIPRFPFPIDASLASRGGAIYAKSCARCHDWHGEYLGEIEKIDEIGTDRYRLDSYTQEISANQNTLGAGQWWRFHHFRKTEGYVNAPLDGLWARAPYLHNGSAPSLAALLMKPADRPSTFYRGDDAYDKTNMGFRSDRPVDSSGRKLFKYDTAEKGNANTGHTFGTDLSDDEKKALLEYLKTL